MDRFRQITKLKQKAYGCLDAGRHAAALKLGRELKKLGEASAFEILALAYERSGKLPRAIAVLEEGVAKAADIWMLWELLGNFYSDAERYAEAEEAYQRALQLEGCDRDVVQLNRAIAFNRADKNAEAGSALRLVRSPSLRRWAEACRIRVALALGDIKSARRRALRLARWRPTPLEQYLYDGGSGSDLWLACAQALRSGQRHKGLAMRLALRAVEAQSSNAAALALIRELGNRPGTSRGVFRLLIHGVWNAPLKSGEGPPGFYRILEVAAASEASAFRYAKAFFPSSVRQSLSVEAGRQIGSQRKPLEGVYYVSGYTFHPQRRSH